MPSTKAVDLAAHPLTAWQGPLGLPDFTRIGDGDFCPVFDAALKAHEAEIDAIAGNADAPTIENTLAALELGGEALDHVSSIFWCRAGAHTNDDDPGAGARHLAKNVAAFLGDLDERETVCPHRRPLPAPREPGPRRRDAAGAGKDLERFRPLRRQARCRGQEAAGDDQRGAVLARHEFRPERAGRRTRLGAVPRRGRPCRPAGLPEELDGRSRRDARPEGPLRRHPVALDLRAVHDLLRTPRPARDRLPRLHHARPEWRRHRQHARSCATC